MKRPIWTICIDPGLRHSGVALYEHETLYRAWLAKNPVRKERGPNAWFKMADAIFDSWMGFAPFNCHLLGTLVIECPQIYWGQKGGGNAADIIELAGVVGAVSATIPALTRVHFLPRKWKGQVPKDTHNRRVMSKLSAHELPALEPVAASLQNNMIDAIGLGLFHFGRIKGT